MYGKEKTMNLVLCGCVHVYAYMYACMYVLCVYVCAHMRLPFIVYVVCFMFFVQY